MTAEEILVKFMQGRYEKRTEGRAEWCGYATGEQITSVELDEDFDSGWSEYTPSEGWLLQVECQAADGARIFFEQHSGLRTIEFIHDLCRFAASLRV